MLEAMVILGFAVGAIGLALVVIGMQDKVKIPGFRRILSRSPHIDAAKLSEWEERSLGTSRTLLRLGGWLALAGLVLVAATYGLDLLL